MSDRLNAEESKVVNRNAPVPSATQRQRGYHELQEAYRNIHVPDFDGESSLENLLEQLFDDR